MSVQKTIAALCSAAQPAGVAIVRISGPLAKNCLKKVFSKSDSVFSSPRKLIFGEIFDPQNKQIIDQSLAVFMPGPDSFTGEDVVEFNLHGSPLLVQKLLAVLFSLGVDPAQPGEFSKRAFTNGKLDLAQAEAIADLINASNEQALKIAQEQLQGRLSSVIDQIGEPLRDILAEIEAAIDFPEEDIQPKQRQHLLDACKLAQTQIENLLKTYQYGQVVREGFRVLICGCPNAGKSSLLNKFLGTERAIVTDIAGTTRDLIEEVALIDGYKFVFCDTAGIRETEDKVEKIGVDLAKKRAAWADLILLVVDPSDQTYSWKLIAEYLATQAKEVWLIKNKADLPSKITFEETKYSQIFSISAKTGTGIENLCKSLVLKLCQGQQDGGSSSVVLTNQRHKLCLERALESLNKTILVLNQAVPLEIVSLDLRQALQALEELIGKTWTEDILGRIFSKFCIGK